jgi:hypothetical protein
LLSLALCGTIKEISDLIWSAIATEGLMSKVYITDIIGDGSYAIPEEDAELTAATLGLDGLLSVDPGVLLLAYTDIQAFVRDDGVGVAEGTRTLNAILDGVTYDTNPVPSESSTDEMCAAIRAALMGDEDITAVGEIRVNLFAGDPT